MTTSNRLLGVRIVKRWNWMCLELTHPKIHLKSSWSSISRLYSKQMADNNEPDQTSALFHVSPEFLYLQISLRLSLCQTFLFLNESELQYTKIWRGDIRPPSRHKDFPDHPKQDVAVARGNTLLLSSWVSKEEKDRDTHITTVMTKRGTAACLKSFVLVQDAKMFSARKLYHLFLTREII